MARLVAFGDAHLGRSHLAHLRDDQGRNVREEDFLRSFDWAIAETIRREPDGFVWLGDVFDHARPSYRTFARVLVGLQRLQDAGLAGVAISGNHDTPRLRGTGSPYDALERVFANVTFAWAMEHRTTPLAGLRVHAVPHALTVEDFRAELDASAAELEADATSVLLAHVALTSLPASRYEINELEVEEAAFDRRFDLVLLGHYHVHQKASKRTWYAGSTDAFHFSDRPNNAIGPKGLVVLDTGTGTVEHVPNPHERPLQTYTVEAEGMGPSELPDAVSRAAHGSAEGAVVRVFLNHVDPSAFRQVAQEELREAVPSALHVQVEPDYAAEVLSVQGAGEIGTLTTEWGSFVEGQDVTGLDRVRVRDLGVRFLETAEEAAR